MCHIHAKHGSVKVNPFCRIGIILLTVSERTSLLPLKTTEFNISE